MFPFKCLTTILEKLKMNYDACTGLMLNDGCMRFMDCFLWSGKIYLILLANKGSQILIHVKGELKQFIYLVLRMVVDLI